MYILLAVFFLVLVCINPVSAAFCLQASPPIVGSPILYTGMYSGSPDVCGGGILLTVQEYDSFVASPTLTDIFTIPIATDLGEVWLIGFTLPMIIYLSAWALGQVVNFLNTK